MQSFSNTPAECLLQRLLQIPKVIEAYQCFLEKQPDYTSVHVKHTVGRTIAPLLPQESGRQAFRRP
jgi:hypothetical protein